MSVGRGWEGRETGDEVGRVAITVKEISRNWLASCNRGRRLVEKGCQGITGEGGWQGKVGRVSQENEELGMEVLAENHKGRRLLGKYWQRVGCSRGKRLLWGKAGRLS